MACEQLSFIKAFKMLHFVENTNGGGTKCLTGNVHALKTRKRTSKNACAIQNGARLTTKPVLQAGFSVYKVETKKPQKKRAACCLLYTSDAADDLLCVDLGG